MVKARQRSRRKDPEQEAIVQLKDEINERMSKLIELEKEVKKGLNGGPAPEVGVPEKVNLTQPLPDSVPSAADALLQELSAITNGIHRADQMQDAYSAGRSQKMMDRAREMEQRSKQMEELQQEAVEAAVQAEMRKNASNPLTRAWSHIVAPFGSEKGKWERLSMLRSLARINHTLKEVEDQILSGDPSILNALHAVNQLYLDAKSTFFDQFRNQLSEMIQSTSSEFIALNEEVKGLRTQQGIDGLVGQDAEPLSTGPTQMPDLKAPQPRPVHKADKPKVDKPDAEIIDKLVRDSEGAVEEAEKASQNLTGDTETLEKEPVKVPSIPSGTFDDIVKTDPGFDDVVKPESEKPESEKPESEKPESVEEFVQEPVEPEPEQPDVDVGALRKAMRTFIMNKTLNLYQNVSSEARVVSEAPEPWFSRLRNIWVEIGNALQVIRSIPRGDRAWVDAYLSFVNAVGDWTSNVYAYQSELKASELKPDFEFGVTINDDAFKKQTDHFLQTHWEELYPMLPPNDGLISEGSDRFTRWLKRMRTHLSWGPDKNLRLLAAQKAREARRGLQAMMNTLEKRHINFRTLISESDAFYDAFIGLYDKLADLGKAYNSRMMIEKSKNKYKKERMKFDIIRETDIREARNIRDALTRDRQSIKSLDDLESKFSDISSQLEKLKVKNV